MTKKILLLGSGELGKEFVIAAQRLVSTLSHVIRMQVLPPCR